MIAAFRDGVQILDDFSHAHESIRNRRDIRSHKLDGDPRADSRPVLVVVSCVSDVERGRWGLCDADGIYSH